MILDLWRRAQGLLKPASAENGRAKDLDPIEALKAGYHSLSRLAEQIHTHAERAPYLHVAQTLRRIAAEKRKGAGLLKEKILAMGENPGEPRADIKTGKNHWERMVLDLEDHRAVETNFLEHAARLAEEAAEISDLFKKIVASESQHKESLLDLIARADPQANQS